MSALTVLNRDVITMSRTHLGARAATFTAGVAFVAALGAAANLDALPAVAMVAVVLMAAWHPHTLLPLIAIGFMLVNWLAIVPAAWSAWTVLAALSLLVFHAGAAVCAAVPAQAPLPASVWASTGQRVGVVAAVTVVVWVMAAIIEGVDTGSGIVPAMVAFGVLSLVLAAHYRLFVKSQADSLR